MSDYEYESDAMDEYQYSDGGDDEYEMEEDKDNNEENEHFDEWNHGNSSNSNKNVMKLCDIMKFFPSHCFSHQIQRTITTSQIPDEKAVFVDYW